MMTVVGRNLDADQTYKKMRISQAVSREAMNPLLVHLSLIDVMTHPRR